MNGAAFRFLAGGSFRYLRSTAKKVVKTALGRPHRYPDGDVLYRQYVRQLLGGRSDGTMPIDSVKNGQKV